ncbi:YhdP family phospholipid transporter [Facilibium subflavum]|uniref:YhdP family phospholipid transporter n=1 Tax=Facilibium subflavum TaxID=2219058 RepID=UPI000E647497|nr:AsmA-like C-terminal region-containing protein [Facilibium subflavum]
MRRRVFISWLGITFISFIFFLGIIIYGSVRFLPYYQKSLEQVFSNIIGSQVTLKVSYGAWQGIDPVVQVEDVHVQSKQFHIDLPDAKARVSLWQSLLSSRIVTKNVVIDHPVLYVNTTGKKVTLNELSTAMLDQIGTRWSAIQAYLLAQKKLSIHAMKIITDHNSKAYNADNDVIIDANYTSQESNNSGVLQAKIYANKMTKLLQFYATVRQRKDTYDFQSTIYDPSDILVNNINHLLGKNYVTHLIDSRLFLSTLSSNTQLKAIHVKGRFASMDFQLPQTAPIQLKDINFNLHLLRQDDQFILAASPLVFVSKQKRFMLQSALMTLSQHRLHVKIPKLDLKDFSAFSRTNHASWRQKLMLEGKLRNITFSFDPQKPGFEHMRLYASISNIGVKNSRGMLDFSGLSGQFYWHGNKGSLMVYSPFFFLGENAVFTKPWPLVSLFTNISFFWGKKSLIVDIPYLQLQNANLDYKAYASANIPLSNPKDFVLNTQGRLFAHHISDQYQSFLPKKGIPDKLYRWLMQCLYQADNLRAVVDIDGMARNIPFDHTPGRFTVDAVAKGAKLSPYFGWGVADADGRLSIDNQALRVSVKQGKLGQMSIDDLQLEVPNIAAGVPSQMHIVAKGHSDAKQALSYLQTTKHKMFADKLAQYMNMSGLLQYNLDFVFPLGVKGAKDNLHGDITLNQGLVSLKAPINRTFYNLNGQVSFANQNIVISSLTGAFAPKAPFHIKGNLNIIEKDSQFDNVKADITAKGIMPKRFLWQNDMFLAHDLFAGAFPFSVTLDGDINRGNIRISSNFIGLQSKLGVPFSKSAFMPLPSYLYSTWLKQKNGWQLQNKLSLGQQLKSSVRFDISQRFDRIQNLHFDTWAKQLSLQSLLNTIELFQNKTDMPAVSNTHQLSDTVAAFTPNFMIQNRCMLYRNYYDCLYRYWAKLVSLDANIKIDKFLAFGYTYPNVLIYASSNKKQTDIKAVDAKDEKVSVMLPFQIERPIELTLQNIFIPWQNENQSHQGLDKFLMPNLLVKLPTISLKATNLQIGRYGIPNALVSIVAGAGSIQIPAFSVYDQNSQLLMSMSLSSVKSQMTINGFSKNWGQILQNFGYDNILKGGSGHVYVALNWPKIIPNTSSVNADIKLAVNNGILLSVNSNAAKYIGLFSLDAYFKRLFLSNSDLAQKGMSFNSITGRYQVSNGVAKSMPSIIIDTPAFSLVIEGKIYLLTHMLDQTIKYQPHFSGTTAAVVGFLGGPAVGLATYLGTKVLGNTLFKNLGLATFYVTGNWDDPKVATDDK